MGRYYHAAYDDIHSNFTQNECYVNSIYVSNWNNDIRTPKNSMDHHVLDISFGWIVF